MSLVALIYFNSIGKGKRSYYEIYFYIEVKSSFMHLKLKKNQREAMLVLL
jgi:hypothetical protein